MDLCWLVRLQHRLRHRVLHFDGKRRSKGLTKKQNPKTRSGFPTVCLALQPLSLQTETKIVEKTRDKIMARPGKWQKQNPWVCQIASGPFSTGGQLHFAQKQPPLCFTPGEEARWILMKICKADAAFAQGAPMLGTWKAEHPGPSRQFFAV